MYITSLRSHTCRHVQLKPLQIRSENYAVQYCCRTDRGNMNCLSVRFNKVCIYPVSTLRWDVTECRDFRGELERVHSGYWLKFTHPALAWVRVYLLSDSLSGFSVRRGIPDWISLCLKTEVLKIKSKTADHLTETSFINSLFTQSPLPATEIRCGARSRLLWGTLAYPLGAHFQNVPSQRIHGIKYNSCLSQPRFCS